MGSRAVAAEAKRDAARMPQDAAACSRLDGALDQAAVWRAQAQQDAEHRRRRSVHGIELGQDALVHACKCREAAGRSPGPMRVIPSTSTRPPSTRASIGVGQKDLNGPGALRFGEFAAFCSPQMALIAPITAQALPIERWRGFLQFRGSRCKNRIGRYLVAQFWLRAESRSVAGERRVAVEPAVIGFGAGRPTR
jgi:hypothetical protein